MAHKSQQRVEFELLTEVKLGVSKWRCMVSRELTAKSMKNYRHRELG